MQLSSTGHGRVSDSASPTKIVIQGVSGAFHEIAARQFFGKNIQAVPALSFPALFEKMADSNQSDAAVLAIENSIVGGILGNYKLLINSGLRVIGEVYLRIQQNLMAFPGVTLESLREVHSHPMALAQCEAFFKQWPRIRLVESEDTAESAAHIARHQSRHIGAIASTLAAERYGLDILAEGIETVPENYTRFLALSRPNEALTISDANKATICFRTPHQPGSLVAVLKCISDLGGNLTHIQSVTISGRPWEYQFFADITADNTPQIETILRAVSEVTLDCLVLGIYRQQP